MSVVEDLKNSVPGSTKPAYLVVRDYREFVKQAQSQAVGGASSAAEQAIHIKKAAASALQQGNASAVSPGQYRSKYFKVQFNPSELKLNGSVSYEAKQDAQVAQSDKQTLTDSSQMPSITLSLSLYFDAVNQADAFQGDALDFGAAAGLKGSTPRPPGKVWTVQPQVEALIAALRNNYTRDITFYWGDFSFSGQLVSVGARYTMFSRSGRPIRAQVDLRICQEQNPGALSAWYEDFTSSFQNGEKRLAGAAQKAGGLLNRSLAK